ncbi:hypothetical protein [Streptomyces sp. NPDC048462]|uniref:hypothetical protein n=1 Tax=Streptomyces sp. NPDC048462 TaxID=3365555 RepID=UPI00371FD9D8
MTDVGLLQWRKGYAAALAASDGLRAALAGLGIPERNYRSIRPAMTSGGRPYVYLGIVNAGAVEAITAALLHQPASTGEETASDQDAASSPHPGATSPPLDPPRRRALREERMGPAQQ